MRIAHVIPAYFPAVRYGGTTIAVHGLCRALAARGHYIEVFTTDVDGAENSAVPLGRAVNVDGVHIRYFASNMLRRLCWSPQLGRALNDDIGRFEIIHLHSVFLWPTWVAARFARREGIPYLISPHGMLVKDMIRRRSRLVKSAWIKLIERRNLEGASAVQVTSRVEERELSRFGFRLRQIAVIPNGVDDVVQFMADISADVKAIVAETPLVLFLGRMSWIKGLDRLLKAFALTSGGTLALVGPDDEKLTPRLVQLADELQISSRVRFLSRMVSGADKECLFNSASVCVLPSYSENFGLMALESMQRGVPVIVTPEVGAAEVVVRAEGGLVVQGEPEVLGAAISRVVGDPVFAKSMGESGRRYTTAHYGWDRVALKVEQLYENLHVGSASSKT